MERYIVNNRSEQMFRRFFQMGGDMDGYIYSQEGEGIGSFFGNLIRRVIPLATKAIKGIAGVAKPHLQSAAKDLVNHATKKLIRTIVPNEETEETQQHSNPRKRRRKQ